MRDQALGPAMVDLRGLQIEADEREMLAHPMVGAVLLFARNFQSPAQLRQLTDAVRAIRQPELLIAVDHEGGRVQRFREGFTAIPAMRRLGDLAMRNRSVAKEVARAIGTVIATELISHGVDFSFTPVLDVDFGESGVIGDRSFAREPHVIAELAAELIGGMAKSGASAVGKHFPGHGYVKADSHVDVPVDHRKLAAIQAEDLVPYRRLIPAGLAGVMPAHVVYPEIDSVPAGYSSKWLKGILRSELGFDGMIFSDDLSMAGAQVAGDIVARGHAALEAGCDMVLVCNSPGDACRLLDGLHAEPIDPARSERMRAVRTAIEQDRYAAAKEELTCSGIC